MNNTPTLDSTWLRNRVAELGLRQWWLAEQVGVDRKTVTRWLGGQVRSIQPANARLLAGVLGCRIDDLLLDEPAAGLASADDQRAAGLALAGSQLLERLGPIGEWDLAERLIRASAVPDLPLHVLGRLYHQLCVACWRQGKFVEAAAHNQTALEFARRCDDKALIAQALGSLANLCFWRGELAAALGAWHEALALSAWLTPPQRGSLHSNLGASLAETGDPLAGRAALHQALACFEDGGTAMQRSIARAHLASVAILLGDFAEASLHLQRSRALARQADYRRGLAYAALLGAEIEARAGGHAAAATLLRQALDDYAAQGIAESLNHRIAATVWRLAGRHADAVAAAQRALACAAALPLEQAQAWQALALAQAAAGDVALARQSATQAAQTFRRCGALQAAANADALAHAPACPREALADDATPV